MKTRLLQIFNLKKIFLGLIAIVLLSKVHAQGKITLTIGDKAPSLKYSKWIKGTPIDISKGDKLYVLEFWATWCGPCKAAMPHLTETQKKYGDKINIIGVGVWERPKQGLSYESTLPIVEKFVEGNSRNMGYNVIADNNEQYMGNKWLRAAGQNGIPSTFVVKDEKILWIGHPMQLDSVLQLITGGNYDIKANKKQLDSKLQESERRKTAIDTTYARIEKAIKEKEYAKAFDMMDLAKKEIPSVTVSMNLMKFETLLKYVNENQAISFGTEWSKNSKNAPQYIVATVANTDNLNKQTYLWAAQNFEDSRTYTNLENPVIYHYLASAYIKAGNINLAILGEERALEGARVALKEGKLIGTISDQTIEEYQNTLDRYKKTLEN